MLLTASAGQIIDVHASVCREVALKLGAAVAEALRGANERQT